MDVFERAYRDYQTTELSKRLYDKYGMKPYYQRFERLRSLSLVTSFAFNLLSITTASVLVYLFLFDIMSSTIIAGIATAVLMVLLESSKRLTASRIFLSYWQGSKTNIGLVAISALLAGLSIALSYNGADKAVNEYTPPPATVDISIISQPYDQRIIELTDQIKAAQKNTWNGVMYKDARQLVVFLSEQIAGIEANKSEAVTKAVQANETTLSNHTEVKESQGLYFALFALSMDLLLLLCLAYLEYYDYRTWAEFSGVEQPTKEAVKTVKAQAQKQQSKSTPKPKPINDDQVKRLKSKLASYEFRLRNGIGKASTAERNIAEINRQLEQC